MKLVQQFEFCFLEEGPVMAKVWVIEHRARVVRLVPVLELGERLAGKVWGWVHIKLGSEVGK